MPKFPRELFFKAFAQIKSMPLKDVKEMFASDSDEELLIVAKAFNEQLSKVGFVYASFV